jgi:hypothetical protein
MDDGWIPIKDAADKSGYSAQHVRALIRKGKVKRKIVEGDKEGYVRLSEVLAYRDRPVYYTPCPRTKHNRIARWVDAHRIEAKTTRGSVLYKRCKVELNIEFSHQVFYLVCREQGVRFQRRAK